MIRTLVLCALLAAVPAAVAQDGGDELIPIKVDKDLMISDFLDVVSKATGKPMIYDPNSQRIRGQKIGVSFEMKIPKNRAFDKFRAILAFYELILVPVGPRNYESYLVIDSRSTNNIIKNKAIFVPYAHLDKYADQDGLYISTAIPVQHITNLTVVRTALAGLTSPAGIGRVHEAHDKLIVMDFAPTVAQMARVVRELDTPQPAVVRKMELVRLAHAPCAEVADVLIQLTAMPAKKPNPRSLQTREKPPTRIAPYPRLNAVAIYADEPTRDEIKKMIAVLDVPAPK